MIVSANNFLVIFSNNSTGWILYLLHLRSSAAISCFVRKIYFQILNISEFYFEEVVENFMSFCMLICKFFAS